MKGLMYLTVILMVGFVVMGCSGMTAEQRKGESDLRTSVGDAPFCGLETPEAWNSVGVQMYGR